MLVIGFSAILKEYLSHRYSGSNDSVVSNVKAEKLVKENKRSQIIEFNTIQLIDSLNQLYIIPVQQKNLKRVQNIEKDQRLEIQTESIPSAEQKAYKPLSSSYRYYYGYNTFNNILIYDGKTGKSHPIFSNRIAIVDFIIYSMVKSRRIFIVACDEDFNGDGKLDKNDKLKLFVYDVHNDELDQITENAEFIRASWRLDYSDNIILRVGLDRDNDKKFSPDYEPEILKTFNVIDGQYTELVDTKLRAKLQDILDGKYSNKR